MPDQLAAVWNRDQWDEDIHLPDTREWFGYGYVYRGDAIGRKMHTSLVCNAGVHALTQPSCVRIELVDGRYIAHMREERREVHLCESCPPPLDWKWQTDAACLKTYEDFFDYKEMDRLVETYCNGCPVRLPCFEWAIAQDPQAGIYGGVWIKNRMTPEIEERLRKEVTV